MRLSVKRRDRFYHLVGTCITEWSILEETLFELFQTALGATKPKSAIVFYVRTHTLGARLSLTNELVKYNLSKFVENKKISSDPELEQDWKTVFETLQDMLPLRNACAHHPFKHTWTFIPTSQALFWESFRRGCKKAKN
jgi:hypothetical protein